MKKSLLLILGLSTLLLASQGPSLVEVAQIKKANVNPLEEFVGTIHLSKQGDIASQSSGQVSFVSFSSAKKVKKGDILVKIDSKVLDTDIKIAKQNLNLASYDLLNAKKDFQRYEQLIAQKSVSQKDFDDVKLAYEIKQEKHLIAQSTLDKLLIQKEYKTIKAPYDGVISAKKVELGEWLNIGSSVGTIVNDGNLDLVFDLPSSYIYKLDPKHSYKVMINNKELVVNLVGFIPNGNIKTRSFQVKFEATNKDLMVFDGMEVKIALPREKNIEALVIPRDGVIRRFNQDVVFVNNDSMAKMIPVKVINFIGDQVAIAAEGLSVDMSVVVKGNERIFPNSPIKVINK